MPEAKAADVLLCIKYQARLRPQPDEDERRLIAPGGRGDGGYVRAAPALDNTLLVAGMCNLKRTRGHHAQFQVPEPHPQTYLRQICEAGLNDRYGSRAPARAPAAEYELEVIHNMGFDAYFLIVWDLAARPTRASGGRARSSARPS
jgi:DNA polymerase-3 subunit alpha